MYVPGVREALIYSRTMVFETWLARVLPGSVSLSSCIFVPNTYENLTDNVAVMSGSPGTLSTNEYWPDRHIICLVNPHSTLTSISSHRQHFLSQTTCTWVPPCQQRPFNKMTIPDHKLQYQGRIWQYRPGTSTVWALRLLSRIFLRTVWTLRTKLYCRAWNS